MDDFYDIGRSRTNKIEFREDYSKNRFLRLCNHFKMKKFPKIIFNPKFGFTVYRPLKNKHFIFQYDYLSYHILEFNNGIKIYEFLDNDSYMKAKMYGLVNGNFYYAYGFYENEVGVNYLWNYECDKVEHGFCNHPTEKNFFWQENKLF